MTADSDKVAEALKLLTRVSLNEIRDAVSQVLLASTLSETLRSPAPPISPLKIDSVISETYTPQVQLQLALMKDISWQNPYKYETEQFQELYINHDGTKAVVGIPAKNQLFEPIPRSRRLHFLSESDKVLEAAKKCGVPEMTKENGRSVVRGAVTRHATRSATINGAWQSAALTALFDVKLLFDGEFKQYITKIGVSGLSGGAVTGLSSWLDHPFFGNGIVLGVLVGSAFSCVSLVTSGDWVRFGRTLGISIIGAATASIGTTAGVMIGGAVAGPIGIVIGSALGGLLGGLAGKKAAEIIPGFSGMTEHEVQTIYESITNQLADLGVEHDPSMSPEQVVTAMMTNKNSHGPPFQVQMTTTMASLVTGLHDKLADMQRASPEAFDEFLKLLRDAAER